MKKTVWIFSPFVWAWREFLNAKTLYKAAIVLSILIGAVVLLNVFKVINIEAIIFGEPKVVSVIEQNREDSLRRVDSIEKAQVQIAKAQKRAEADSMAAQEARVKVSAPKKPAQAVTLATMLNEVWWWMIAVCSVGLILVVFYFRKKPSGFFDQVFALTGKIMLYGGILYLICFAFYMRNQKIQRIPFYADEPRIRWVIDSTAMANPKQVVYAPDTASFRIIDSLTRELLAYQRDNIAVQTEQAKTIDSLMVIISDQPIEEPVVSKPKEVEKKTAPAEEKKKDPVVVKKKKKPSTRVAVRDTKTKVYAPGSSGLSRSVQ